METGRIQREVRAGGITESGLTLFDKEGVQYHWVTKQILNPLFTLEANEWMTVKMTISKGDWGLNIAKNVRIVKDGN